MTARGGIDTSETRSFDSNNNAWYRLPSCADSIECLAFDTRTDKLAIGCWDGKLRLLDIQRTDSARTVSIAPIETYDAQAPILDAVWRQDGEYIFYGNCNNELCLFSPEKGQAFTISTLAQPVSRVRWLKEHKLVATSCWDGTIALFDGRSKNPAQKIIVPEGKIGRMDAKGDVLVASTKNQNVRIYDIKKLQSQRVVSTTLKKPITCLSLFSDATGYALASCEGRCSIRFIEESVDSAKNFTFKCHRKGGNRAQVYAVHSVAFHPNPRFPHSLSTTGDDGCFVFWEKERKLRLKEYSVGSTSALEGVRTGLWNSTGDLFACSIGNTYGTASATTSPPAVVLHYTTLADVRRDS